MRTEKRTLQNLFVTMFQIGIIGFGGGNALIPVIQQKVVEEQGLVSSEEYEEDVLIASITPGALPVEIASGIGHRIAGWKGAIVGSIGMALPGVILTLLLLSIFSMLDATWILQIRFLTVGITAFICLLLTEYIKGTFKKKEATEKYRNVYKLIIIVLVFLLTSGKNFYRLLEISGTPLFGLSTIHIFILSFFVLFYNYGMHSIVRWCLSFLCCIGFILCVGRSRIIENRFFFYLECILMVVLAVGEFGRQVYKVGFKKKNIDKGKFLDISMFFLMVVLLAVPSFLLMNSTIEFMGKGLFSSIISFGGGDAYLTVADGLFVESQMITENEFYANIVPVVNVLPGSILCKTLSGIGFYVGQSASGQFVSGLLVALLGFVCSVAASVGIFMLAHIFYGSVSELNVLQGVRKWIRTIVSGLMLTVICSLVYTCRTIQENSYGWIYVAIMILIYAVCIYFRNAKKYNNIKLIGISVAMALVLCNVCHVLI